MSVCKFTLPDGEKITIQFQPTSAKEVGIINIYREDKYNTIVSLRPVPPKSQYHLCIKILLDPSIDPKNI